MAAFTLAALSSEIATDPQTLGYAGKTDAQVASLLNQLTGNGIGSVFRNDILAVEIIDAILSTDFAAMTALQLQKLALMCPAGAILDATNANTRTIFVGIFSGMANTVTALTALASRTGSRAEVLWGTGKVISAAQISQSRNGS